MNRSSFLKSLIGIYGIAHLPIEQVKQYEKVYLKQFFVRGFTYYEGPNIIEEINKCGVLQLVREPKNHVDSRAIALYFNKQKIGFVPRESNKTLSILMDTELLEFHAEITHIEQNASDWEKIRVAVYALKEIKTNLDLKKIEPFNLLYTPTYYSLKSGDNTLTRISNYEDDFDFEPQEEIKDTGVFLHKEIINETNQSTLSVVYYSYDSIAELENQLEDENKAIKYTTNLQQEIDEEDLSEQLLHSYLSSVHYPEKNGIFAINVHKLFDQNYKIAGLNPVIGKHATQFFEVVFDLC